jgi:protein arginine kinase
MFGELARWMKGDGESSDIVLSSRVRLARNLHNIPFTNVAGKELLREILFHVRQAAMQIGAFQPSPTFMEIGKLSPIDRFVLLERHLISTELLTKIENGAVMLKDGEELSLMINEEDHLRLQSIKSGLNLLGAWETLDELDNELSSLLQYSYDEKLGYLTACPTNLGTGMRVSVLLHLPALVLTQKIDDTIKLLFKYGYTIRGIYGEGSNIQGTFFQISNIQTLGKSEIDIINDMEKVVDELLEKEDEARDMLYREARYQTEDKIFRSYGILRNAKLLNSDETMNLLSALRLGVSMQIIDEIPIKTLNELLIFSQPAHIQLMNGKGNLSPEERDIERANWMRDKLCAVD